MPDRNNWVGSDRSAYEELGLKPDFAMIAHMLGFAEWYSKKSSLR